MNIRTLSPVVAAFLLAASAAVAQPKVGSFGFGIILGEPTGLSLKGDAGGKNAWDAGIGPSWFGNVRIHADYLWAADVFNSRKAGMYFGLGAVLGLGRGRGVFVKGKGNEWYYYDNENAVAVGLRVPVGLNFMPFKAPVELFAEIAPIIGLVPSTGLGWDGAIGIRYYP